MSRVRSIVLVEGEDTSYLEPTSRHMEISTFALGGLHQDPTLR